MNEYIVNPQIVAYVRKGWAVFPVHTWLNGCCSCGKTDCDSPAKHPWCEHGFHSATTDINRIKVWATAKPGCNWGIRTGMASNLFVLDEDIAKNGEASLIECQKANGALPLSPTVRTGGGGRQFYFLYPTDSGLTIAQGVWPGIDYRGEGGYVVAPPSLHRSGQRYE